MSLNLELCKHMIMTNLNLNMSRLQRTFKLKRQAQNLKFKTNIKCMKQQTGYYMSSTCTWWTTSGCRGISDTKAHLCEALLRGKDLGRGPTNLNGLDTGRWSTRNKKKLASKSYQKMRCQQCLVTK